MRQLLIYVIALLAFSCTHTSKGQGPEKYEKPQNFDLELDSVSQKLYDEQVAAASEPTNFVSAIGNSILIEDLGLRYASDCGEICEGFLIDSSNDSLWLPSDYDQGVLGMVVSPEGKQLAVYSSYDGPDWENYYYHRAEIYLYNIEKGKGIEKLKICCLYTTQDWSIESVSWVSESMLSIKAYTGSVSMLGLDGEYTYYLAEIQKND